MKIISLITIIVLTAIAIYSPVYAATEELWLLIDDVSGSMGKGKGTPHHKNVEEMQRFIRTAGKGVTIMVLAFGRRADVQLLKVQMPSVAGPQNRNVRATQEAAIKKLNESLSTGISTIDRTRTDVHGALLRVSRIFSEHQGISKKRLVILSDMLENENFSVSFARLKRPGSAEDLFKTLKTKGVVFPDLKGIEVECYSAFTDVKDLKTAEIEIALRELKCFWGKYFTLTGASFQSYKTTFY